jgi:hypothetical protein
MALPKSIFASTVVLKFVFRRLVLFGFLSLSFGAQAQTWVRGYLRDKVSQLPIINGEIRSSSTNTLTDSNGFFRIRVTQDDIVSAKKFGYRFDTIHFSYQKIDTALVIYLEPIGSMMKNVTVATSYSAYQVDSIRRRMAFDEGRSKTSFVSKSAHPGFGLVFSLDRFTKTKDKHLKKQRELFEETERWAYIHSRFPDSLVQAYTSLGGDSLHIFMNRYTPSYEWLRAHPSKMEVIYYINDKLKLFRKENYH